MSTDSKCEVHNIIQPNRAGNSSAMPLDLNDNVLHFSGVERQPFRNARATGAAPSTRAMDEGYLRFGVFILIHSMVARAYCGDAHLSLIENLAPVTFAISYC